MIRSTKNYTKKKKKYGQTQPQDKCKGKAIETKLHKKAYRYTVRKREK